MTCAIKVLIGTLFTTDFLRLGHIEVGQLYILFESLGSSVCIVLTFTSTVLWFTSTVLWFDINEFIHYSLKKI